MIGRTISHYKILEKLGEGGMGVVYKAEDVRLRRPVALKFLPFSALGDEAAKARFLREARAAAALQHPNICTVYEIDEAEGQTFIAMAYLEGEELTQQISKGPLSFERLLDIAIQVARGLQEAHGKGVVHRDIKPANIMDTTSGQAVLMDFGLAQVASAAAKLTREGTTVGTSAYMSPEQTTGEKVDERTDIWALGVVIYEMATGKLPFQGHYEQAILYSILNDEPEPVASVRSGIPSEFDGIVSKCLAKRAGERYQTVGDLLAGLRALKKAGDSGSGRRLSPGAKDTASSIAVLPFLNMNRDEESEFFSDGVTEDIINALMRVEGLKVAARSSVFQFKGKNPEIAEVGRRLKVQAVLEGSVRRAGRRLRVTAQLINTADGYQIWSERYDRVMEDIFDIQDEISQAIVEKLKLKLTGGVGEPLVKRYTENIKAYNLYLKGRYHWYNRTPDSFRIATKHFERAIAEDARLAPAYAGLADCHAVLAWYGGLPVNEAAPKAESLARKALEIDPQLGEAHATLGFIRGSFDWNWVEARSELEQALQLSPNYAVARFWYGCFCLVPLGQLDEALAELRRGLEIEPLSPFMHATLGIVYLFRGQYDDALENIQAALELAPHFPFALGYLGEIYCRQERYEEAAAVLQQASSFSPPGCRWGMGLLAYCYGRWGKREEAQRLLSELEQLSKQTYVPAFAFAMAYIGMDQHDLAFEWLNRACDERPGPFCWLHVEPLYDPLRGDPRFRALLDRVGLPA